MPHNNHFCFIKLLHLKEWNFIPFNLLYTNICYAKRCIDLRTAAVYSILIQVYHFLIDILY